MKKDYLIEGVIDPKLYERYKKNFQEILPSIQPRSTKGIANEIIEEMMFCAYVMGAMEEYKHHRPLVEGLRDVSKTLEQNQDIPNAKQAALKLLELVREYNGNYKNETSIK